METTTNTDRPDLNVDGRHDEPKKIMDQSHPSTDAHGGHDGPAMDLKPIGTGKVVLFGVIFVALFALLFFLGYWPEIKQRGLAEKSAEGATDTKPIVDIAKPHAPADLPALQLPGDAQAFQATAIYPRTNGYLKRRLVDIGDHVEAGQLLAEIDTPEVDAQLAAAQATLQQAKANAQKAKDDYDLASSTYERYQGFAKTGGVTQQQLDERKSTFTQAKSNLAGTEATVRADEAEVQRLTALQSYEKVVAPFAGTITARNYDVGALLSSNDTSPGKQMFDLAQTDVLRVFVNVPQTYSDHVKKGQPAQFLVTNYPGKKFDGTIARTAGAIDQASRTLRVEVDIPNKTGELFAGMYGYIHYELPHRQQDLLVPSSALIFGPSGTQLALVDASNRIKFTKVSVGRDLGTEIEITQGINPDDRIVANPGERLSDNVEVQITPQSAENAKATAAAPSAPAAGTREALAK